MLIGSIFYLYRSVAGHSHSKNDAVAFSRVRRAEIAEEVEEGRLTAIESSQLLLDVDAEVSSQGIVKKRFLQSNIRLARWLLLSLVSVVTLGSVSLYERLGYAKEVAFTQDLQAKALTPARISDFLQYRSRRYDRVEDWYYEATDFMSAGRYKEAVSAFAKALKKLPLDANNRASLQAEYAQAIFYANDNKSSAEMRTVVDEILAKVPNQATALGLKGVDEFSQKNYLAALLAWQEAIRYNADSTERIALLSGIERAREAGNIDYQQVPAVITNQLLVRIVWDPKNIQWQSNDVLLVYAVEQGKKMPVAIQRIFPTDLKQPILLTNLDALMPTKTLGETERVDLIVRLANINDQDLTKGRIIGAKRGLLTNRKEILIIKVAL
ncbi:hypothetical protein I8J31_03640 [Marinomonas sp. C1424]|uniref:Formate-dependent nitrite reductase complex subunit NrfG n=2 Tax=Marinomonas transparens TaxID=2795388 RepID=A0A934JR76_9GAMM|nr:hypothetical protein [Marinomonas transparens]